MNLEKNFGAERTNHKDILSRCFLGVGAGIFTFAYVVVQFINYRSRYLIHLNTESQQIITIHNILMVAAALSITLIIACLATVYRIQSRDNNLIRQKYKWSLEEHQKELTRFIKATNAGTWEWDILGGYIHFNKRVSEFTGYSVEELTNLKIDEWLSYIHPEDLCTSRSQTMKTMIREIAYCEYECRIKHKNGHWIWVHIRGEVISWTHEQEPLVMSGTYNEITKHKKTTDDYVKSTEKYKSIIEISNTGVWEYDVEKEYLWCSDAYFSVLGYKENEFERKSDKNLDLLWTNLIHPEDREDAKKKFMHFIRKDSDGFYDNHFRMKRSNGEWAWIWSRGKIISDKEEGKSKYVVGTHLDVTEMKEAQRKIEFLSYRDSLTGLYNRRYYEERLQEYNTRQFPEISLIIFDVNGLKLVNDAFGHLAGDKLLKKVAEIILSYFREQDCVARIGGDEFVVLMPNCDSNGAENLAGQIIEACEQELIENMPLSVSCGWATKKESKESIELVFTKAEDAMYHNKAAERRSLRYQSVQIIMKTLNEKIPREEAHSKRVSDLCLDIGKSLELNAHEIRNLQTAAMLHDIGKIGISNTILNKEGPLNEEEWLEIKKHPKISFNILSSVNEYGPLADIVLSHHERWDGKGYPHGLKEEEIPLKSRIISIADAFDAMVCDRPYRAGMSEQKALKIIESEAGKQFDPELVKVFLDLF